MTLNIHRHSFALILLCLLSGLLYAQPYQVLHAYDRGSGPITGTYVDVANLSTTGHSVAVGQNYAAPAKGLVTEMLPDGTPTTMLEIDNSLGNAVITKAVCRAPNDDVIACFYDPVSAATDVIRFGPGFGIVWRTRLPSFQVEGVACDTASVPAGEMVWLTGSATVSGRAAIEGLDATFGTTIFASEYNLISPHWTYQSAKGFKIAFNRKTNQLTVVGSAMIAGGAQTEMFIIRTNAGGGFVWARGYGDPFGNDYYHGKCLVLRNPTSNYFTVGFEYSATGGVPFDQPGAMTIDPSGNPTWINAYPGAGFFNGRDYNVSDISLQNARLLLCGSFDSFSMPGTSHSAYSLCLYLNGAGVQFNEYELAGLYPVQSSNLRGIDQNPVSGHQVMVGTFVTSSPVSPWPWGADPNSFWAIASDRLGTSNCSRLEPATGYALSPVTPNLSHSRINLPFAMPSPLILHAATHLIDPQCASSKQAPASALDRSTTADLSYHPADRIIRVTLSGELSAPATFQLVDVQGRILANRTTSGADIQFDAKELSAGVYWVRYEAPGIGMGVKKVAVW